ncbi:MAG: MgtC/SapB family protein [Planctomycetota bacterium]
MHSIYELTTAFDAFGWLETIFRLVLAILAGGVLGWERERLQKPAGLRTHMMVALGSATFMLTTLEFATHFQTESSLFRIDPTRTLAGIIGGVGFLGAGTIMEARGSVHGITTAASIWVVAAIGVACGVGLYQIAFTSVLLAFTVLTLIGFFEAKAFDGENPEQENEQL